MANLYSQKFTLLDIFNNKRLRGKLPLINYREIERENGKTGVRTRPKSVSKFVFDTSVSAARPYYKPIIATKSGDIINISGELVGNHDSAVDAVFRALTANKGMLEMTANDTDIIRDALKEAEKNKRQYGIDTKLHLRVQSMLEIESMSKKQLQAFMSNIIENILYGDNFPKTQKKWGVADLDYGSRTYEQRVASWKQRIGE